VDSPRETYLRLCLVLAGLPVPECNLIIGDDQGPIGRVDLVYLAHKLIIEYEGDQHRTDRNQWNRDIDRHEDFARDHWTLIRVTSERARWPAKWSAVSTRPSEPTGMTDPRLSSANFGSASSSSVRSSLPRRARRMGGCRALERRKSSVVR
jgi:hypothetical protein